MPDGPNPSSLALPLLTPLLFTPRYQVVVWGGRKMAAFRDDLPDGPVGESWDLADHERGMSVVRDGPWAGVTLRELTASRGKDLVGDDFSGGTFPLMIKLIDATDRLSVQVHPDNDLARDAGLGSNGKTECWFMLGDGGELFQGTRPGVDREEFEEALAEGRLDQTLNRFETHDGDFFFLPARTVHALGRNCLLYEVQQTSDITFRVWDWGRVGLDGKPRPLHVKESLQTIDFSRTDFGKVQAGLQVNPAGGFARKLADCAYFEVNEHLLDLSGDVASYAAEGPRVCTVVTCLAGTGAIATKAGSVTLLPMQTALVPAAAGPWQAIAESAKFKLLTASPKLC